jgi:hypothetical protein
MLNLIVLLPAGKGAWPSALKISFVIGIVPV